MMKNLLNVYYDEKTSIDNINIKNYSTQKGTRINYPQKLNHLIVIRK